MSDIKFKIAAKTDVGRVRKNNEDNLQAASDLTTAPMKWVNDMECDLGDKGALLVVADGMGGMNAGEVASEIAIATIREFFSSDKITQEVVGTQVGIETFMKKSIQDADAKIKQAARQNPNYKGMGTTIVIAWLLDGKVYVAWCGDSRAYIFNKVNGLRQISKDHSYVQTLVDKGKITKEDAFDYPDSNIITRCLSDSDQKARPDIIANPIDVCNGDIILLCTDGLCGMIRDHEIEQILVENNDNLSECSDKLIEAACEASGDDNITVALCKVLSGALEPKKLIRKNKLTNTVSFSPPKRIRIKKGLFAKLLVLIVMMGVGYYGGLVNGRRGVRQQSPLEVNMDSVTSPITNSLETVCDSLREENGKKTELISEYKKVISDLESENKKLKNDTARINEELKKILKQVSNSPDAGKANKEDSIARVGKT